MKITFPYWGNYTIVFKTLFQGLKMDVVSPQKTTSETIKKGAEISPEMFCFPLKINIGNYLEAIEKGADTIFMATNSSGNCRFRYYPYVQEKILKEAGYRVKFIIFDQNISDFYRKLKKVSNVSSMQILKSFLFAFKKLRTIEYLEKKINYLMPRTANKKQISKIFDESMQEIDEARSFKEIFILNKKIRKQISKFKIIKTNIPKVGIIGEIYTVSDSSINYNIEKKLGLNGIEARRRMNITYHIKKSVFPWKKSVINKEIKPYLKSTVGGHGAEAVQEMLDYIKQGFDGIIHLLPFGCMPEVSVRPILEKIHKKTGIPLLSLSLDEQVAEAGIDTRIEAFVDVVKNYYRNKNSHFHRPVKNYKLLTIGRRKF